MKFFIYIFIFFTSLLLYSQNQKQLSYNSDNKNGYLYRVNNTAPSLFPNSSFTVEAWVYIPSNATSVSDIFDINGIDVNGSINSTISLGKNGDEIHFSYSYDATSNSTNTPQVLSNGWNHIALVSNNFNFSVIVNGTNYNLINLTNSKKDISKSILVVNAAFSGKTLDTSNKNFANLSNLIYDEIRIWNKALSLGDVIANFYKPISVNSEIVAYYPLDNDDISLGTIKDLAPNGFNLTIYGKPILEDATSPIYNGGDTTNVIFTYTPEIKSDIVNIHGDVSNGGSANVGIMQNQGITGSGGIEKIYGNSWIIENRLLDSANLHFTINDLNKLNFDTSKIVLIEADEQLFINPTIHSFSKNANGKFVANTIFGDGYKAKYYTLGQSVNQNPKITSTNGFGPFIQGVLKVTTFEVTYLPPASSKVMFYIIDRFGSILDSMEASYNSSRVKASISYDMGSFPLNALFLIRIFYTNGPTNGINFVQDIQMTPIIPRLTVDRAISGYNVSDTSLTNKVKEFNSYKLGDSTSTLTITVDSLPSQTTKVVISFTDANDNNLCYFDTLNVLHCDTYTRTPDIGKLYVDKAVWTVKLDTLALQLSSKIGVRVYFKNGYQNGSLFTYPMKILPPDIQLLSTNGWAATSNNYEFNTNISTPWTPIQDAFNLQFSASNLPPQTRKVIYSIIDVDSTVLWVDTVRNSNNRPLDGSLSNKLNMRNLDIKAYRLNMKIIALGSPKQGLNYYHEIQSIPQYPRIAPSAFGQYIVRDITDSNDTRTHILNIKVEPSQKKIDSMKLSWVDNSGFVYQDSLLNTKYDSFCQCNLVDYSYDVLSLPYKVNGLKIQTFYKGAPNGSLDTIASITLLPPPPKAKQLYNDKNTVFDNAIDFYPRWSISNLPEQTLRTIVNITSESSNVVATDTIYPNKAPYDYYANFEGNSYIKSNEIKQLNEFTAMTWFNTSSSRGGVILNISDTSNTPNINVFMTDSGFVAYSMNDKTFKLREIGNTLYKYNFGNWHHLAVILRKKDNKFIKDDRLEVYIDGGLVETLPDTLASFQSSFSPILTLGHGALPTTIDPTYPFYPASQYFTGSLSDFRFINKALSYSEMMQIIKKADSVNTVNLGATALWWKLNDVGQTTIKDHNGKNDGKLTGTVSWNKTFEQHQFNFLFNTKGLNPAKYYLDVIPQYYGGPDIPYSYRIDSISVNNFVMNVDTNFKNLKVNILEGTGYFEQGDEQELNVQVTYNSSKLINKSGYIKVYYVMPDGKKGAASQNYVNSVNDGNFSIWAVADIDVGSAPPGSFLYIEINDSANINHYYSKIPLFLRKIPIPLVTYNQGPFIQAIAPGTMQNSQRIMLQNVGDDVSKISLTFFDDDNVSLDNKNFTKDATKFRTWYLDYDMASLRPPRSTFQFMQFANNNPEALDTTNLYPLEIIRTRPIWMNKPSLAKYENISETNDSVKFDLKLLLVPSQYEFTNNFGIPASFMMIGGGQLYQTGSLMEMPMAYSKNTRRLRKTGDAIENALVANFEYGYLKDFMENFHKTNNDNYFKFADEFDKTINSKKGDGEKETGSWAFEPVFESKTTNKVDIDTNNLLTIQHKSRYMIGAKFDIPAIDAAIKELNATITAELAPWSALIRPVFGFSMELDLYTAERKNYKSDSLGNLYSAGELVLKANEEGEDDEEVASYQAYGALFGLNFSLGAEIAMGAIGKVTVNLNTDFPLTFVKMYNQDDQRNMKEFDFAVFWSVDASIFFGLIHITVVPKSLLYHAKIAGDEGDFQVIYAKTKTGKEIKDFIQSSKDERQNNSIFLNQRSTYPQPDFETKFDKTGMIWLEQSPETGFSTLVFSENSKDDAKFNLKKYIHSSNSFMNAPKFDYISENKIALTWVQNRFNVTGVPGHLQGFEMMNEIIKGQDIWYAVYNLDNDSLEVIGAIPDNNDSKTSGRTEGNPLIKAINDKEAMIVWTVSDLQAGESDLHYSTLKLNNDTWNVTNANTICGVLEGAEINQSLGISPSGEPVLSWINVSNDQSTRKIMGSVYKDAQWSSCNTIAEEMNGTKIRYLDQEFEGDYGALVWTEGRLDKNEKSGNPIAMETIKMVKWNNSIRDWDPSTLTVVLDSNLKEAKEPNIEINKNGKLAIIYQNNEMDGPVRKVNALLGNMNNKEWNHLTNNPNLCDTNRRMFDYDFAFHGDTLMLLSQETLMNSSFNRNLNYTNGIAIGPDNANLVLRSITHNGNATSIRNEDITKNLHEASDEITLYPNPASSIINIQLANESKIYSIDLLDARGKFLREIDLDLKGNELSIDISNLTQGIYYISYINDGTRKTKSFVVIK